MATFELDKYESELYEAWVQKHLDESHDGQFPYSGAIGGLFSFVVTGTSLGTIVSVRCGICESKLMGKEMSAKMYERTNKDSYSHCLTNFDDW